MSAYCDSLESGTTQIHFFRISDTALSISYTLHNSYKFPYAGIAIEPETNYFPNLSAYDYIDLDLSTSSSRSVQFFLNVYEPGITMKDIPLSYRYVLYEVQAKHNAGIQRLWLKDFKTPIWWYPLVNLSEKDLGEHRLDKIAKFSFSNGVIQPLNERETITIRSISVGKNYYPFITWALISLALYYTLLALVIYYRKRISGIHSKVIPYQQLKVEDTGDKTLNKIVEYLFSNYTNPELSLTDMAHELGFSARKISDEIKEHYNLSFKQYINNIRFSEAKRLLKESNLPINEIAYKVGFNNISHFNRAFRQYCNCSPQEYRSQE